MTILLGAKSRLISFELGARERKAVRFRQLLRVMASGVVEHIAL